MPLPPLRVKQVELLEDRLRRLHKAGGSDSALESEIRAQVIGELTNVGRNEIISCAYFDLMDSEPEVYKLFHKIVKECVGVVVNDEVTLAAIVIPVAVRLHTTADKKVSLDHVPSQMVNAFAMSIKTITQCKNVAFSNRLYSAQHLDVNTPRVNQAMRDILLDHDPAPKDISPFKLDGSPDPKWQMVYLLGVQARDSNTEPRLHDKQVQTFLYHLRNNIESAFQSAPELTFDDKCVLDVSCKGVWYFSEGLVTGESLLRDYKLKSFISSLELGVRGVSFHYVQDGPLARVRLLASTSLGAKEFVWPQLRKEPGDVFLQNLLAAIDEKIPASDVNCVAEVDVLEFDRKIHEKGLVW